MIRHIPHRSSRAVGGRSTAQERYPLRHIATPDLCPPAIDGSLRAPVVETLFGRHCNELVCPLAEDCVVSDERTQPCADRQAHGQRRRMNQPSSLNVAALLCANAWSG